MDDSKYKGLERKRAQDKYDEEVRAVQKKQGKQETLEKDWSRRETMLRSRKKNWLGCARESQEFAAGYAQRIRTGAAQATRFAEGEIRPADSILQKTARPTKRLADLRSRLGGKFCGQAAQIASCRTARQASSRCRRIALQLLRASEPRRLAHINQIAMEQAKPRSPQDKSYQLSAITVRSTRRQRLRFWLIADADI